MSIRVVFNHLPDVIRSLPGLADDMDKEIAGHVHNGATDVVPVRTGRLKNSIKTTHVGLEEYEVSAETPYAAYVEWGTRHMNAQPYMMPGFAAGLVSTPVEGRVFGINVERVARTGN